MKAETNKVKGNMKKNSLPAKKTIYFVRNIIHSSVEMSNLKSRKLLITEKEGSGLNVAVFYNKGEKNYTYDYKKVNQNNQMVEFLSKHLYSTLDMVKGYLKVPEFYIYINVTNKGEITVYDMNVNDSFLDYDDLQIICNKFKLKTQPVIFKGVLKDYKEGFNNKLVRYDLELPEDKRVFRTIKVG